MQYADIDHMDERKDFTIDGTNFANLDKYFKKLQDSGMRIIIILVSCSLVIQNFFKLFVQLWLCRATIYLHKFYRGIVLIFQSDHQHSIIIFAIFKNRSYLKGLFMK